MLWLVWLLKLTKVSKTVALGYPACRSLMVLNTIMPYSHCINGGWHVAAWPGASFSVFSQHPVLPPKGKNLQKKIVTELQSAALFRACENNAASSSMALTPEERDPQLLFELKELARLPSKGGRTTAWLQLSSLPLVSRPDRIHARGYSRRAKT